MIIIPAYNEEGSIAAVIDTVRKTALPADILVVNDGSTDDTAMIAQKHGVHLLGHSTNLGKGAALQTGFRYILQKDYEVIFTLDADGQHDPLTIPSLLRIYQTVQPDLLIASRAGGFHRMTFLRRFWNRLGVKAVARLCHGDITDSQSGFRLIRTKILREISLTTTGFEMELELLIKACKKGYTRRKPLYHFRY